MKEPRKKLTYSYSEATYIIGLVIATLGD